MKLWWRVAYPSYKITEDDVDLSNEMATFPAPGPSEYQEQKYQFIRCGSKEKLIASKRNDLNCVIYNQAGNVIYKRHDNQIFNEGDIPVVIKRSERKSTRDEFPNIPLESTIRTVVYSNGRTETEIITL